MLADAKNETRASLQSEPNNRPDPYELQLFLDQVPSGLMTFDRNGTITFWNRRLEQLTGISRVDVLGRATTDVIPMLGLTSEEQSVTLLEQQIKRRGLAGDPLYFDIQCSPMRDEAGKHIGFSATLHDVTERKLAEDARQQQQDRYQYIIESITDGFFVVDSAWKFTYINEEAAQLLQRPREELIGNSIWELFPETNGTLFSKEFHRAVAQQVFVMFQSYFEPLDLWIEVRAYPLKDGLSVHFSDITAQQNLTDAKDQHFQTLFEDHPDAILSFDLRGRCMRFNKVLVEMSGYSESELVGNTLSLLLNQRDLRTAQQQFQLAAAGKPQDFEAQLHHKDGHAVEIKFTNIPIVVNDQIVGIYGILQDISERKLAEAELRSTKDRLEAFLNNSADAIWMIDREDLVLQVNPAFESLFGWSKQEIAGKRLPIMPEALLPELDQIHNRVKRGHSVVGYETQRLCRDGRFLHVSATLSPLRNSEGTVIGVSGTCRDISSSKLAAEELCKTKERLEAFLQNSADAIWMVDLEERVLQINPAFELLFGWSEQEVLGKRLPIIPDEHSAEIEVLHQQIKGGTSISGFETRRLCKDGRLLHVSATLNPVRDSTGRVIGVSGTCRDITHNKLAEEELRATKELFESIFNFTTDSVIVFDLEGNVLAMNAVGQEMVDFELNEDIVPPNGREKYLEVRNGQAPFTEFEICRKLKDGRQFDLQVTLSPIRDGNDEVSAILLMAKDITENKKTQELLVQSEKLSIAGQLAAGVAHEIRNPLTALKGFVQLMGLSEGYQERYLQVMASELERIEMIVSELLVLAKPQALNFKRKSLVPVLNDVLTLSSTQAILHNVQILTQFAEDLPELDCDDNQLKQVFINFIKNAIEAMPDGGTLQIEAQAQDGEQVRISLRDEGTGIPPEHLRRLGEPFYTTKTKGTGLGLMVSKKIIEHHQGSLNITSEVGVGTMVEVYLPIPSVS